MQLLFQTELSDELSATARDGGQKISVSLVQSVRYASSAARFQRSALNHTPELDPRHATKTRDQWDFVVGNNAS
jgi:hypothetical protein